MVEQVQQVTMKDPKKVKAGTRLAESNKRKRQECVRLAKAQSESNLTYYSAAWSRHSCWGVRCYRLLCLPTP